MGKDEDKAKRLAEALRENLRKRKAGAYPVSAAVQSPLPDDEEPKQSS